VVPGGIVDLAAQAPEVKHPTAHIFNLQQDQAEEAVAALVWQPTLVLVIMAVVAAEAWVY
jgi:hypothetical protein